MNDTDCDTPILTSEEPSGPLIQDDNQKFHIDFDAVLRSVGGWGRFQKFLFHGLCLPIIFATSLLFTITVFSAAVPNFRCRIRGCDTEISKYSDSFVNKYDKFTIPANTGKEECYQFHYKGNSSGPETETCVAKNFDRRKLEACQEWIYDKSMFDSTFMSEANIVCNDSWKDPLSQSIFFVGVLVAALSSGLLADKFGRRHVTMTCVLLLAVSSLGVIFVRDYVAYVIVSFFLSIAQAGLFLVSFILAMEMVGVEKRVFCGIVIEIYFVVGEVLVAGLTYWQRDWRKVAVISTVPVFLFLAYWPILPESARWLLAKKRYVDAQLVTNRISNCNKRSTVDIRAFGSDQSVQTRTVTENESMVDLLRDSKMACRLLNLCVTWLVIVLGYYGLSLSSVSLSGDPYLNFFLVSLVEIPGYLIAWLGLEKIGRRRTMVISLVTAGVSLLANAVMSMTGKSLDPDWFWLTLIAYLVGKCGLTAAFGAVYVYSSELFPTSIRTAGVGTCSTCGRLGAIVTPWISDMAKTYPATVMIIFGGSSVIAGSLNLLLPETLGVPLPENLAEARRIGDLETSSQSEEDEPLLQA